MTKEMQFFADMIDEYAAVKEISAQEVLKLCNGCNLAESIYEMYYRTESREGAFEGIENLMVNNA